MKEKRILVAGATGYLGRYVVQTLRRDGWQVRVLVRNAAKLTQEGHAFAPAIHDCVDEIITGDVTQIETLHGAADGMSAVFSSVSLMGQTGRLTWHDVDYLGNRNILHEAQRAGVQKFVYVSVFNAGQMPGIPIVRAHEDFAAELAGSGMDYAVIRPTGYFSDLGAFFDMARSGRAFLLGSGKERINPIHGADLARVCVNAIDSTEREIDTGGPEVLTQRDIAEAAFAALGKPARITTIPAWVAKTAVGVVRPFQRDRADLWRFFVTSAGLDNVAPTFGKHRLIDHYRTLAAR
ncbi:MAG: SDR family oxidoreductase [Chloroflexota bacterium]